MHTQLKAGLVAGLAAAAIILLAALAMQSGGATLAVLLFALGLLPLLLAGLRFGAHAAGVAALVGSLAVTIMAGPAAGLAHALALGGPGYVLSYLAGLHRFLGEAEAEADAASPTGVEWYPPGHIIAWTAVMAGTIAALGIFTLGQSEDAYLAAVKPHLERFLPMAETPPPSAAPTTPTPPAPLPSGMSRDEMLAFLARSFVPASLAVGWFLIALCNLWLAAWLLHRTAALPRPWPDIARFEFPRFFSLSVVVAIFASFLPGLPGIFAAGFTGGFFFAYLLLGLAVLHVITTGMTLRPLMLGAIYLSVLFLQIGIFVMLLGIGEQIFRLRSRVPAKPPT